MFREEVLVMDAVVAITLMECSLNKSASFGDVNILHTSFPVNAEFEYKNQAELILGKLDLPALLERELEFIENNFDFESHHLPHRFSESVAASIAANDDDDEEEDRLLLANSDLLSNESGPEKFASNNFDIISQLVANLPSLSQMVSSTQQNQQFKRNINSASTQRTTAKQNSNGPPLQSQYIFQAKTSNPTQANTNLDTQNQRKRKFDILTANDSISSEIDLSQLEEKKQQTQAMMMQMQTQKLRELSKKQTTIIEEEDLNDDDLLNFDMDEIIKGNHSIDVNKMNNRATQSNTKTFTFKRPENPMNDSSQSVKKAKFRDSVQELLESFKCNSNKENDENDFVEPQIPEPKKEIPKPNLLKPNQTQNVVPTQNSNPNPNRSSLSQIKPTSQSQSKPSQSKPNNHFAHTMNLDDFDEKDLEL